MGTPDPKSGILRPKPYFPKLYSIRPQPTQRESRLLWREGTCSWPKTRHGSMWVYGRYFGLKVGIWEPLWPLSIYHIPRPFGEREISFCYFELVGCLQAHDEKGLLETRVRKRPTIRTLNSPGLCIFPWGDPALAVIAVIVVITIVNFIIIIIIEDKLPRPHPGRASGRFLGNFSSSRCPGDTRDFRVLRGSEESPFGIL